MIIIIFLTVSHFFHLVLGFDFSSFFSLVFFYTSSQHLTSLCVFFYCMAYVHISYFIDTCMLGNRYLLSCACSTISRLCSKCPESVCVCVLALCIKRTFSAIYGFQKKRKTNSNERKANASTIHTHSHLHRPVKRTKNGIVYSLDFFEAFREARATRNDHFGT